MKMQNAWEGRPGKHLDQLTQPRGEEAVNLGAGAGPPFCSLYSWGWSWHQDRDAHVCLSTLCEEQKTNRNVVAGSLWSEVPALLTSPFC